MMIGKREHRIFRSRLDQNDDLSWRAWCNHLVFQALTDYQARLSEGRASASSILTLLSIRRETTRSMMSDEQSHGARNCEKDDVPGILYTSITDVKGCRDQRPLFLSIFYDYLIYLLTSSSYFVSNRSSSLSCKCSSWHPTQQFSALQSHSKAGLNDLRKKKALGQLESSSFVSRPTCFHVIYPAVRRYKAS